MSDKNSDNTLDNSIPNPEETNKPNKSTGPRTPEGKLSSILRFGPL